MAQPPWQKFEFGGIYKPEAESPKDIHGSARWMNPTDVQGAGFTEPLGVIMGETSSGSLLHFNRDGHMMVFAPTGAGKGIGFVQPNLTKYSGSMVVLDPKGENAIRSAKHRRKDQTVIVLDPFGKTGMPSDFYNPLGALSHANKETIGPMIEAIADALIPNAEHAREPHWPLGAKRFISFLCWFMVAHLPESERNLIKLYELAHSPYETLVNIADAMAKGLHPDPDVKRVCISMGNWFLGREHKEYSYFESQVQNNLGWIGDFVWTKQLGGPPSPPIPLKSKKITVYLVLPFHRLDRYRPWLRLMVADLLNSLYDATGNPKEPVLFMLDEAFSGLGQMDSLFSATATVRSAGARLCFVYQDIAQVKKLYGEGWRSLIANSGATLFFGVNEIETAQFISSVCGSKTVPVPGNPQGVGQPLIRPEQVMQLPTDTVLGLFRNLPPAQFGRLNVLSDNRFKPFLDLRPENSSAGETSPSSTMPAGSTWVPIDLTGGNKSDERLEELSRRTRLSVRQLKELESEFGKLDLRGSQLGYINERGYFTVVAEAN